MSDGLGVKAYKFTRQRKDAYLKRLKEGSGRTDAAFAVGVDPKTVEREIARGNDFTAERDAGEMFATDVIENSVWKTAKRGNLAAQKMWFEAKRPEVWRAPKDPVTGNSPATPLYIAPGSIDWDAIPEDLADRFIAIHDELVALQPGSGGLFVDGGLSG